MSVTVLAVRHARTVASDGPVGRRDVALAGSAAEAARAIVEALEAREIDAVWTSPLERCMATARLVAATLARPLCVDPRLLEIDLGAWDGRSWADIEREEPDAWAAWLRDWQRAGPPGGESAEQVAARVEAWLAEREGRLLLVAHAGVVRALRVLCSPSSWPEAMATAVPHAGEPDALLELRRA